MQYKRGGSHGWLWREQRAQGLAGGVFRHLLNLSFSLLPPLSLQRGKGLNSARPAGNEDRRPVRFGRKARASLGT